MPKAIAQSLHALHRCEIPRQGAGHAEANGEQRAFGSGASASLMPGAMDQRLNLGAAADIERADAFWGIDLVAGNRKQINAERADPGWDLSNRLRRIGMEANVMASRDGAYLFDRLDRTDLVIGVHDANEDGAWRDGE